MNNLLIDGNNSDLRKFVHPTMSLSSARADMNKHTFSLDLDKNQLLLDFGSKYEEWVQASKAEDESSGGGDPDDLIGLAGYPELKKLIEDETLVEMLFGWHFIEDVFKEYCCTDYDNIQYWYDAVESATVTDSGITIYGICYSQKQT